MSDTQTLSAPAKPTSVLLRALHRIGMFSALFSAAFAAIVWVSAAFLLPTLSHIDIAGKPYTLDQLAPLKASLLSRVSSLEDQRGDFILPVQHESYGALKEEREAAASLAAVDAVHALITNLSEGKDNIHLAQITLDSIAHTLTLTGDTRNAGQSSMTLLATFVDGLAQLPGVKAVSPVPFTRMHDPKLGELSPFTVTLTLN